MSKYLKSFVTACLVICMAVCLGIFAAACNNEETGSGNYFTVTVKLPDDSPVSGVKGSICTLDGSLQTCIETEVTTDSDGVAKFNLTTEDYDISDSTIFLIKLHDLPDGYIYADDDGIEYNYSKGEGREFDSKVTGKSVTIKLTAKALPDSIAMSLGKELSVEPGKTYTFTAPEADEYKIFASNAAGTTTWTLDGVKKTDEYEVVTLTKGQKISITIDGNGSAYVVKNSGSSTSPVTLALDNTNNFEIALVKNQDPMSRGEKLMWDTDGSNYHTVFTPSESGDYKFSISSNFQADNLDILIEPTDSNSYPDVSWPEKDETATDTTYFCTATLEAGTNYSVKFTSNADFKTLSCTEGFKIKYGVKVEKHEEETSHELQLDTPVSADWGLDYVFTATNAGAYVINFTNVTEGNFTYSLNGVGMKTETTAEITLEADGTFTVTPDAPCTITVTLKPADSSSSLTLGTAKDFTITLADGADGLGWNVESYDVDFTPTETAQYKITLTFAQNYQLGLNVKAGSSDVNKNPDSTTATTISYTCDLTSGTVYTLSIVNGPDVEFTGVAGDTLNYSVKIEKV